GARSLPARPRTTSRRPVWQLHRVWSESPIASKGSGCQKVSDMKDVTPTSPSQLQMQPILEEFFREGCVLVPGILDPETVAALRAKTDFFAADPSAPDKHKTYAGTAFVLRFCHELDPRFAEVAARDSILSLVGAVLDSG